MLTDESLMPFGKHKGLEMADVPAEDLLFYYEQWKTGMWQKRKYTKDVMNYVDKNRELLERETTGDKTIRR